MSYKITHGRVNYCDSPKINLNCRDGPCAHDSIFWKNSAASGRSDSRSGQFCSKMLHSVLMYDCNKNVTTIGDHYVKPSPWIIVTPAMACVDPPS